MANLTVGEIATRVKRQFGDEAGSQLTDADIVRWINDAMRDIALHNNLLQVKASAAIVAGQNEYTLPADILTLRAVKYNGRSLQPLTLAEADNFIDDHENDPAGEVTHYWLFANTLHLYRVPQTSGATLLKLYYTKQPTAVAVSGDIPEIPQQYHNQIVTYCLAQAYEMDADMESHRAKMQMFEDGVSRIKDNAEWENRDAYPSITYIPDDGVH